MSAPRMVGEVRGVAVPLGRVELILPNAAVAEVVAYREPMPVPGAPVWVLGRVSWRDRLVPFINLPAAGASAVETTRGPRSRMLVCYTPNGTPTLPYVAVFAAGPPRLERFRAEHMEPAEDPVANPFVLHPLTYAGRPAWIPDLDAIERAVLAYVPE